MSNKREMTEERAITILEELRDEKLTVCDLYPEAAEAVFNMAIDGIRKRILFKEMQENIKLLYCIPSEEGITRSLLLDAAENLQRVVPKNNSRKEEYNKSCKTCAHWNCRAWDPPCNKCYRGSGLLQDNYEPNQGTKKDLGKEDPQ